MLFEFSDELVYSNTKSLLLPSNTDIDDEISVSDNYICNPKLATHLVLVLNNYCQLKCRYCYSDTNTRCECKCMDLEIAETSIERIFVNSYISSRSGNKRTPNIMLHGGGEPTITWQLVEKIYDIALNLSRKYNTDFNISMVTNGMLNQDKISWIKGRKIKLQISIDGPKFIQDLYRPTTNNGSSFDIVNKSLSLLQENNIEISIRITCYRENQDALFSFVKYVCDNYNNCKSIMLGMLHKGGRGDLFENDLDVDKFITTIDMARKYARKYNIIVGGPSEKLLATGKGIICNACKCKSLIVNYDGYIINCHEKNDSIENVIGTINSNNIVLNDESLKRINNIICDALKKDECVNCIAYSVCAGGCIYVKEPVYCDYMREKMNRVISYYCGHNKVIKRTHWSEIYNYYNHNI